MARLLRALASSPLSSHDHHRRHCLSAGRSGTNTSSSHTPASHAQRVAGSASKPFSASHSRTSTFQESKRSGIHIRRCLLLSPPARVHRRKVSKVSCEKSAAALRLSARLAMLVSPRNYAKTFLNDHSRHQRLSHPERDSGTKEKTRVHLRCFETYPGIFSMSSLLALPIRHPKFSEQTLIPDTI